MEQTKVLKDMGNISLSFVWMSNDRTRFKYARKMNDESQISKPKWKKFKKQMQGNCFAVLTRNKWVPGCKTNTDYEILGILASHYDVEEMQYANEQYWETLKTIDTNWDKLQFTYAFAKNLQNWFDKNESQDAFNNDTLQILELFAEGNEKDAKTYMKGIL